VNVLQPFQQFIVIHWLHKIPVKSECRLAVAEFNGDGKLDLAVANPGSGGSRRCSVDWFEPRVMLFLNQGNNNFALSTQLFAGTEPRDVIAGDFNGDGKLDASAI